MVRGGGVVVLQHLEGCMFHHEKRNPCNTFACIWFSRYAKAQGQGAGQSREVLKDIDFCCV